MYGKWCWFCLSLNVLICYISVTSLLDFEQNQLKTDNITMKKFNTAMIFVRGIHLSRRLGWGAELTHTATREW